MKGSKIIKLFNDTVIKQDPSLMSKVQVMAAKAQMEIYDIHARATGCHCECMGMNADNCNAATNGLPVPYDQSMFHEVMTKWGIVDTDGKPII